MTIQEKLTMALAALERVRNVDSGPAHHIAKDALDQVKASEQSESVADAAKRGFYGEKHS